MPDTPTETPTEVGLAFDHPLARAEATGGSPDRLSLRDYVVAVEIGAFEVERGETQRLSFNVVVELTPMPPAEDDVDRILSYDMLIEAVDAAVAAERVSLLETLAESIAARVLAAPQATRAFVRIEKLDRGPFKLGVEIERRKEAGAGQGGATDTARVAPVILALHDATHLTAWVDAALAQARPVVVVMGYAAAPLSVGKGEPQRRVDLLALDQAAWAAAAIDPRLTPRASRTEIDWALGRGDPTVWAPARLALDAPTPLPADPVALAVWLAEQLEPAELVVVGAAAPEGCAVPTRHLDADAMDEL